MNLNLTWDETKRQAALLDRGLDFADAGEAFAAIIHQFEDTRQNYGEKRMICVGFLRGRMTVVGYVQRGETRHIFSMRKANEREQKRFGQ